MAPVALVPVPEGWITTNYGTIPEMVYHCCLNCGWIPIEGMVRYRLIMGVGEAECIRCGADLLMLERTSRAGEHDDDDDIG